jgi:hypothetical protein
VGRDPRQGLLDTNEGLRGWNILVGAVRDAGVTGRGRSVVSSTLHGLDADPQRA